MEGAILNEVTVTACTKYMVRWEDRINRTRQLHCTPVRWIILLEPRTSICTWDQHRQGQVDSRAPDTWMLNHSLIMLNVKGLTELLSQNTDGKLCKRWWLMTPNGTLLAYNQPTNTKEIRKQAAMIALSWQEHEIASVERDPDIHEEDHDPAEHVDHIRALTVEAANSNILATRVQAHLLLVLEGGVPPRRQGFEPKTTAESPDDDQYPPEDPSLANLANDATVSSRASSINSNATIGVLRLQRKKLEAMANAIIDEFERTGFDMPEEAAAKFF